MNQKLFEINSTKYYGMYRGTVINNTDTTKRGLCQIMFMPMFQGIDTIDLPWAIPAFGLFDGAGPGTGSFTVPKANTQVWGWFEQGDVYQPVYFAEASDGVNGVPPVVQGSDYPNIKAWFSSAGFNVTLDEKASSLNISFVNGNSISISSSGQVFIVAPTTDTSGNLNAGTGATGTFGTSDGSLVTVSNGIITDID